jgi:hypothetical protein
MGIDPAMSRYLGPALVVVYLGILLWILATLALAHAQVASCQLGDVPDQRCTPGSVASTDVADICSRVGGSYSERHRQAYSLETKLEVLNRYGLPLSAARDFQDDHRVPLCVGGADDPANRWPQRWADARRKDDLEAAVCKAVCERRMSLQDGQAIFLGDWRAHLGDVP